MTAHVVSIISAFQRLRKENKSQPELQSSKLALDTETADYSYELPQKKKKKNCPGAEQGVCKLKSLHCSPFLLKKVSRFND